MRDRGLYMLAVACMGIIALVDLTASFDLGMAIGTLLSFIPYAAVVIIQWSFVSSGRLINSLKGGLLIYLAVDLFVRYHALHHPTSSTDAVAVVVVIIASALIIPAGAAATYLILSAVNSGRQGS